MIADADFKTCWISVLDPGMGHVAWPENAQSHRVSENDKS